MFYSSPKPGEDQAAVSLDQIDFKDFDKETLQQEIQHILLFYFSKTPGQALQIDWLHAVTVFVRGLAFYKLNLLKKKEKNAKLKFVNYLSMEFLIGKTLMKTCQSLGIVGAVNEALQEHNLSLEALDQIEPEPGLGNGGLGRLAACFMDSLAALGIPAFGYGIRYDYGMFTQRIIDGRQVELPDTWLLSGYLWEIHRPEIKYFVPFYGRLEKNVYGQNVLLDSKQVYAQAHDILIPGNDCQQISRIRLWSASTTEELVLEHFNVGDYARAFYEKSNAEHISSVLYPDDRSDQGKELRLKQEYFFASASVQDILYRFSANHSSFDELPTYQSIHLNDTHPSLAVPEFLRVLTTQYFIPWEKAWQYCIEVFSYTNHTLMPEALETWRVALFERLIPQILDILYRINEEFLDALRNKHKCDANMIRHLSIFEEHGEKKVRMANLCIIASHKVNGVSELHSKLMVQSIFQDFYRIWPEKFLNVTNGITQRRWLLKANPHLTRLIDSKIGIRWHQHLADIEKIKPFATDPQFQKEFLQVKYLAKLALSSYVQKETGVVLDPKSLFDVQIKRIHEYKRQLLNVLYVIHRYNSILKNPHADWQPRSFIIAGKAASAYYMAKLIIRFINDVAHTINNDLRTNQLLKLVFIPDYSVRVAEIVIPAADISEQISTAGLEASGTGNMKLSLNGALTLGTLDGANIEIRERVGADNFFLFGHRVEELKALQGYNPAAWIEGNPDLKKIVSQISLGNFSLSEELRYKDIVSNLVHHDPFFVVADFESYLEAQEKIDQVYKNPALWAEKAIINFSSMGYFSSDRAIQDYADKIWHVPHNEA